MSLISNTLRKNNLKCALVPFITAGFPNLSTTINALDALDNNGADVIELGIPYSDALADGPIIQKSSKIALSQGIHIDDIINMLKLVTPRLSAPIIIFTYYNPVLSKGILNFIVDISLAGVSGLIIPDLPLEEADYVMKLCDRYNIELILFIAPTSSTHRIKRIISKSRGCIYLVSSCGVTGVRDKIDNKINTLAKELKHQTDKAIMLGFGISSIEQAKYISQWYVDGMVIGSAFMKIMLNNSSVNSPKLLGEFCNLIKTSIK
uniref:tryptophan synthase alpha subunit n=1 Tax=Hypnea brasiliensis TaxID=1866962 RepID=UPI0023F12177|nr:tryptophan synthase alpha subunit [Hypnea brasiliensis]WCH55277.1 tryptophan synthase alpha subunit [Hypnea brasiliensis]WDY84747.1 tryptophan synthase alpha subunit [Hypnea brasiliensis]